MKTRFVPRPTQFINPLRFDQLSVGATFSLNPVGNCGIYIKVSEVADSNSKLIRNALKFGTGELMLADGDTPVFIRQCELLVEELT